MVRSQTPLAKYICYVQNPKSSNTVLDVQYGYWVTSLSNTQIGWFSPPIPELWRKLFLALPKGAEIVQIEHKYGDARSAGK